MLFKAAGIVSGGALGAGFICVMDDVIYSQLRRNMILPMKQVFISATSKNQVDLDELFQVGQGTANFVSQFKPQDIGRTNAKALLLKDEDYATPDDHYFGYINKRHGLTDTDVKENDMSILKSLNLELFLPPTFNVETGKFDEPKYLDTATGLYINESDMDVFELARMRGTTIRGVKELMNDKYIIEQDRKVQESLSGQRHTKKDYERLKKMSMGEVINLTREERKTAKFEEDPELKSIVKVEKKKGTAKRTRAQQQERDAEIQRLLETPQDINYEKAMQIYEDQSLEAKEITGKEKRKLRRLKKKAEKDVAVTSENPSQLATTSTEQAPQQQQLVEAATSIKIEDPVSGSNNFDSDNIDAVIR